MTGSDAKTGSDAMRGCLDAVPSICARYGLPPPSSVKRLTGGSANFNLVVRFAALHDTPPVKLTFCLYKDLPGARRVAAMLAALDDAPIGRLVGAPDDVGEAAGRPLLVTRFVEGEPLDAVDPPTAHAIGALMAAVHRAPPIEAPTHDMDRSRLLGLAEGTDDLARFIADAMATASPDEALSLVELPIALIHGDLFLDNLIRGADGRLTAIDFEEASRAPRAFDLGMTLVGFARWGGLNPANAAALLAGYRAAVPLEPRELDALPAMVAHAAAATAAWRHLGTPDEIEAGARDWRELRTVVATSRRWVDDGIWTAITGAAVTGA